MLTIYCLTIFINILIQMYQVFELFQVEGHRICTHAYLGDDMLRSSQNKYFKLIFSYLYIFFK